MTVSRVVLRNTAITLFVFGLILTGLLAWSATEKNAPKPITSFADPDVPVAVPKATPEQKEIRRYIVTRHTVVGNESFSLITGKYWDDIFLWPELYVLNGMTSEDPDLIYPDEIIDIYNQLGQKKTYNEAEKKLILDAYIQVYHRFKSLGPHKNGSAWTLLWCGAKYDHDFLDIYSHEIDPVDLAVARRYIEEEGYLD